MDFIDETKINKELDKEVREYLKENNLKLIEGFV